MLKLLLLVILNCFFFHFIGIPTHRRTIVHMKTLFSFRDYMHLDQHIAFKLDASNGHSYVSCKGFENTLIDCNFVARFAKFFAFYAVS